MTTLAINDLSIDKELDRDALANISGGGYYPKKAKYGWAKKYLRRHPHKWGGPKRVVTFNIINNGTQTGNINNGGEVGTQVANFF